MWKVVAADDEGYIREALQKLINWEKMDCSLESVVSDGQELLEKIRGEMPDIVITDIQMPGVDGLEVCKYVYETCPETQVIILTAYSDFEYAKRAIKYSVCEYVLKISIIYRRTSTGSGKSNWKAIQTEKGDRNPGAYEGRRTGITA